MLPYIAYMDPMGYIYTIIPRTKITKYSCHVYYYCLWYYCSLSTCEVELVAPSSGDGSVPIPPSRPKTGPKIRGIEGSASWTCFIYDFPAKHVLPSGKLTVCY